jgi:CheY-like chemotaxis protein
MKTDVATTVATDLLTAPTALVVDDDVVALIVVRHMLESLGLEVIQAADVASARAELANHSIDIVVADYAMPGANGLELLDEVGSVPFVLLSGVVERGDVSDERMGDVTAHLTKPVSSEELRAVITGLVPSLVDR